MVHKSGLIALTALLVILLSMMVAPLPTQSQTANKLYVIIVWHYHQPWYYNENESAFVLPWVRMHSVGNYYKMGYILQKYPGIKVTFTFSGSLLTQLLDYERGLMDYREIISWKIANNETLTDEEIVSMLRIPGGFFDINWDRIVNQIPRYAELRDKAQNVFKICSVLPEEEMIHCIASKFYPQELIDLAVLFNLFWMDPEVVKDQYPTLYDLMQRAKTETLPNYNRTELKMVLNAHRDIMSKIIPLYKNLTETGQAELIPVPYSHPLAPIIADFGWTEDLKLHINKSLELFKTYFNYTPAGVWPAEQAINEYVLQVFAEAGMNWTISDESILAKAGINTSSLDNLGRPWYIDVNGKRLYIIFRDTELSNLISFEYAKWDPGQAAQDLINRLLDIAKSSDGTHFIVIALDGENPWEHYEEFGDTFLNALYSKLSEMQQQGLLETITPREYLKLYANKAKELPLGTYQYLDLKGKDIADIPQDSYGDAYDQLPRKSVVARVPEGSWAGELNIWIGDRQEDSAWMWLAKARSDILSALGVNSIIDAYNIAPQAIEYLLRAEASDWWWWYGGDGGGSPETFDPLFKAFLRRAYEQVNLTPPDYLKASFYPDGRPRFTINVDVPKPVSEVPDLDGYLEDTWAQDVSVGKGLNITIGLNYTINAYLLVNGYGMSLAIVPKNSSLLQDPGLEIALYLTNPRRSTSPYTPGYNTYPRYGNRDLGIGLAVEVLIKPSEGRAYINYADGHGGFIQIYRTNVAVGDVVELQVPWVYVGLTAGDNVYLAIATFYNQKLVETSTKLGGVYKVYVPALVTAPAGKVVFAMDDPEGDDDGAGGYTYPTAPVFKPGVFDMLKFTVVDLGDKIQFAVKVKDLGGNPWNGPNGFCLQYIHIYIRTMPNAPGRTDTFGLWINISKDSAWQVAILVAPGWGTDPVPKGERAAIYYANNTVIVQDNDFKVYADPTTNTIYAEVKKSLLPGIENIDKWVYVVALTSYDGYGEARIRPFGVQAADWVVGAGTKYAQAILKGVVPRVMDLLAPTAELQYMMLNTFNATAGTYAVVSGVSKAMAPSAPTVTVTTTTTETITKTTTATTTATKTVTETTTHTTTATETTTETKVETTTKVVTTTTTNIAYIGGAFAAGLVIGLAVMFAVSRRT